MPQCALDGTVVRAGRALRVRVVARVAVGALRRVRVTRRHVEVALGVEAHAAADVAAAVDLGVVLEDPHLGAEVDLLGREVHREARDARTRHLGDAPVDAEAGRRALRVEAREVLDVDVARGGEVRRHGDAQQAVLHLVVAVVGALAAGAAVGVDGQRRGARDARVRGRRCTAPDPTRGCCRSRGRRSGWSGRGCGRATAGRAARRAPGRCGSRRGRCRGPSRSARWRGRATHRWWRGRCWSAPPFTMRSAT